MAATNLHAELVQLAQTFQKELRYQGSIEGFCYGSSALVIDPVLTSKEAIDEFNKELMEIQKIADKLINSNSLKVPILPESKTQFLWFLYKMLRHQYPRGYVSSQEESHITRIQNLDKTMQSFQSEELRKLGGLHKTAIFSIFLNLSKHSLDIVNYIIALQTTVSQCFEKGIHIPFSLLCCNSEHAFELGYRPPDDPTQLGSWYLFDLNGFNKIEKVDFYNDAALREFFKTASKTGGTKKDINYIINTTFYCSRNNEEKAMDLSKSFLSKLEQCQLTQITAKKAAFGYNLLHMQAISGDFEGATSFIHKNMTLDAQTDKGASALIIALQHEHTDIARLLIENGANLNLQHTDDGASALMIAAQNGYTEIVRLLIEKDANLDLQAKTPLFGVKSSAILYAAYRGHIEIVKLLLDHGANPSGLDRFTPIFEQKFSELMCKKILTLDDKKCLIQLYIILRTAEEENIKKCIQHGLTAFFKPECDYTQKIQLARDLLEALNNEKFSFWSSSPALQEGKLKKIYALCFESKIPEDSAQKKYHAPTSKIPSCYLVRTQL